MSPARRLHLTAPRKGGRTARTLLGVAAGLVASAVVVQAMTRRAERRNPPAGRFVEVDGVRLHYLERGRGETTVVLLHGNGLMLEDYQASGILDRLVAEGHRVIAFDRPGFGHSERPRDRLWTPDAQAAVLWGALARLGVDRPPVVVGHSFGTLVALAMALRDPAAVRGLVLMAGYYFPTARVDTPLSLPTAIPILGDVIRHTVSPLLGLLLLPLLFKQMFSPLPVSPRFTAGIPVGMTLRPSQLRAVSEDSVFMVPAAAALRRHYGELEGMPVAILAGVGDKVVAADAQPVWLRRELPRSDLGLAPGVGHMVHYARPEDVVAAVNAVAAGEAVAGEAASRPALSDAA